MGTFSGFPSQLFQLDGDPSAIRSSASGWTSFGAQVIEAAGLVRSLDTSLFIGPEADEYRDGLSHDLAPHLDRTGEAHSGVGRALTVYADGLSVLQDQMRPLTVRAPRLWDDLQAARAAQSDTAEVTGAVMTAQQAWEICVDQANQITTTHRHLIDACVQSIDQARGQAFAKNPHGLSALAAGFTGFVKDHAAGLAKLSGALKVVSGVAGVLAFVPVIDLIAAPVAIAAGAAALAIDISLKAATGRGSWASIAVDGALMALPGAGKLVRGAAETSARLAIGLDRVGRDARGAAQARRAIKSVGEPVAERSGAVGAQGPASGRHFDPLAAGGPIRNLDASSAVIDHHGVEAVKAHLQRFVPDSQLGARESAMLGRLQRIVSGEEAPSIYDLNFYTHELDEAERYAALGHTSGDLGGGEMYEVWNNVHTAALEDYGVTGDDLFHPEVPE